MLKRWHFIRLVVEMMVSAMVLIMWRHLNYLRQWGHFSLELRYSTKVSKIFEDIHPASPINLIVYLDCDVDSIDHMQKNRRYD